MRIRLIYIKSLTFGIIFLILFFGAISVTLAKPKEEGYYFSLLGVENYINGDFDGISGGQFEDTDIICRSPKIESGTGFGMLIGGYKGNIASEFFYINSNHDTYFYGFYDFDASGVIDPLTEYYELFKDAEVQLIGVNIKNYFLNCFNKNLRVFGQLGVFFPRINMEQAAYRSDSFNYTADATFTGYGFDLGFGILIHLHPNLAIGGAAVFRYLRIDEVKAFDIVRVPTDSFYGTGKSFSAGFNYYF